MVGPVIVSPSRAGALFRVRSGPVVLPSFLRATRRNSRESPVRLPLASPGAPQVGRDARGSALPYRVGTAHRPVTPKILSATPSPLSIAPWIEAEFVQSPATQTPGRNARGARRSNGHRTGNARRTR